MKNQKNTKVLCGLFLSIVFSSLLFTSCKKGDQGAVGPNGAPGTAGTNGANGANGTNGNTILSGEGAPTTDLGVAGDFYLDTKATALYGPKTTAGWGSPVSLVGAQGTTGAAGAAGATALVDTFSIYTYDWMMSEDVFVQRDNDNYDTYTAQYYKRWIPDLTQDILDHGMVMVSFTPSEMNEPSQWLPIPYNITGYDPNSTRCNYNWSYVTGEHTLQVQFYLTPLANVTYYPAAVPATGTATKTTTGVMTAGMAGPDIEDFKVPDARYKVVMLPATVTEEITSITKKQFTRTGKVLSNL
jgi:hypothetical protein